MPVLPITVRNKIATYTGDVPYICGNSDYTVLFDFDEEWEAYPQKTARFVFGTSYIDVVFIGNECPFPLIEKTMMVVAGVFAGNLHTTTGAAVKACLSIRSDDGAPTEPESDVYDVIMDTLNGHEVRQRRVEMGGGGSRGGTAFTPGNALELTEDLVLNVRTTNDAEEDNTLPITSAGVNTIVGNIGAILDTI